MNALVPTLIRCLVGRARSHVAKGRQARSDMLRSSRLHHGQAFERPQARPFAPADASGLPGKAKIRPTGEQRLKRTRAFDARELMAEAEVDTGPERDVPVRSPLEVEALGSLVRLRV